MPAFCGIGKTLTPPTPEPRSTASATVSFVEESEALSVLLERCSAGESQAFRTLFAQHRENVARIVYRMLGPSLDLEDLIQEVFVQVFRSLKDFKRESKFSTWLYRVTVNVVLMYRRAARSRPVFQEMPVLDRHSDKRAQPDEDLAKQQRILAFYRLLNRLSEKKRTVFILHELEGLSPSEIARTVNAPALTVRTRLFYARRELAALMKEEPYLAHMLAEYPELRGEEAS